MQYDNIDVYIDNSKCKKDKSCSDNKKSEVSSDLDEDIVSSCVRMISEETDNTSNALQTPPHLTPRNSYYQNNFFESDPRSFSSRNQRSTTIEEGRNFWIEFEEIEQDGRTTVMVKNIPNKYTQESLLEEFSVKFENRFDFFYLPIDKDVSLGLFRMAVMWDMHSLISLMWHTWNSSTCSSITRGGRATNHRKYATSAMHATKALWNWPTISGIAKYCRTGTVDSSPSSESTRLIQLKTSRKSYAFREIGSDWALLISFMIVFELINFQF